jgi:hypothetical protein
MATTEQVPIRVFGSPQSYADDDVRLVPQIESIIRDRILSGREAPYYEVKVKVRRDAYAEPKYLIAYLLRSDIYMAEVVRIDLDSNLDVKGVTFDYDDTGESDEEEEPKPPGVQLFDDDGFPIVDDDKEPAWGAPISDSYGVDFVVSTPCDDIPTAVNAVNYIYDAARAVGLSTVKLIGSQATVATYKSYLASGVRGFVNIGHGNPNLIVLADGTVPYSWFNGLTGRPLSPAVVYFNSCQVFNDPLKASVLGAGARTFIGGIVNLLIGPSEDVCKCFWDSQLTSVTSMGTALKNCEKDKYPNEGAHGIGGDTGRFDIEPMKLAHAMWTHGVSVQVENPERLSFDRRYGFFARLRGKPFNSTWVHFAVPTPAIVDGKRLHASSVYLRYRTGPGASIGAVHVWDAERRRIGTYDGLALTSGSGFRVSGFSVPMRPPVYYGIGISILLKFGDDANLPSNKLLVDLSAAGCYFALPV